MRAHLFPLLIALGTTAAPAAPPPAPAREIANVAAFARLYGAARYFYPSDAAAALDWNRFAVHGVGRVRTAGDEATLRNELLRLFAPLGPGFEVAKRLPDATVAAPANGPLVAWRYLGPGISGNAARGPYRGKRTGRAAETTMDGFATMMQSVPAESMRGKAVRMRGQVRATASDATGAAALWLRVDRPGQTMGFFDNMQNRPIREPQWRPYQIEGTVATDAVTVAFGVMSFGAVTADFDGIELAVKGPGDEWTLVPIPDAGFEAGPDAKARGWFPAGTSRDASVSRPGGGAPEGRQFLRIAPPAPGAVSAELLPEATPAPGEHADFDLGSGLAARVPLALTEEGARTDPIRHRALDSLAGALAGIPGPSAEPGPDQRMADVVVGWNVFRHFYPYWPETGVDWDARLSPRLADARAARTRREQRTALRGLVVDARDGHAFVADTLESSPQAFLPIRLARIEGRLVVSASSSPEAPVGAVVTTIDGAPAAERFAETARLVSGTDAWREVQAAVELGRGPTGGRTSLTIHDGTIPRTIALTFTDPQPPAEKRPEPIAELETGIWYVDLTRTEISKITPRLDELARARGVVFDVRGYPGDAGARILPHLLDVPETDRWMHVSRIVGPFGQAVGWQSFGWNLVPASPRLSGRVVFLTDGRAISYAESVLGYVADRKLGTIVGATTAGTNGNVASFVTPGGFALGFTGMRVTGHDGKRPHHLVGIRPDVAATPTVEGLRAGRDEVLERGIAVVRAGTASKSPSR
jgi:C-terminal processing protease CtpA/Prc